MKAILDKRTFGPWAIVTGSSSGIGREIARHVATSGINVVLVARRVERLKEVGRALQADFGVAHRVVEADLSTPSFFAEVERATVDLDVGLVVGNAGSPNAGELWTVDRDELAKAIHVKVNANLMLVHHFARGLVARRRGGILLVSDEADVRGARRRRGSARVAAQSPDAYRGSSQPPDGAADAALHRDDDDGCHDRQEVRGARPCGLG
jgi:NADP-dependent 3-hydroxy acid dehydrogenase YdfG